MEISTYEQQATDFLKATNTTFKTEFVEYAPFFPDDKEARNIWKITLQNVQHKYIFKFGASIADSTKEGLFINTNSEVEIPLGLSFPHGDMWISYRIKTTTEVLRNTEDVLTLINWDEANKAHADYLERVADYNKKMRGNRAAYITNVFALDAWQGKTRARIVDEVKKIKAKTSPNGAENDVKTPPTPYDVLACLTKYDPYSFENFCSDFGYDTDSRQAFKTYKAVRKEWKNVEILFNSEQLEQLQEIQ